MKLICLIIFIFCNSHFLLAQKAIEYKWQSSDGKTVAQISITPAQENVRNKKNLYLIALQDSINKNFVDISYNDIVKRLPTSCTIVKIYIEKKLDSQEVHDFFALSTLVVNEIFPFLQKKNVTSTMEQTIIAGVDAGAEIALISALSISNKFNKTALFFSNAFAEFASSNQFDVLAPNIKGKLFIYVKHAENEMNVLYDMTEKLTLKSSIMLYKIDAYEEDNFSFDDGYNWLIADGNNYVLKTDD